MPARTEKKKVPPRPPQCAWSPLLWSLVPLVAGILTGRSGGGLAILGLIPAAALCLVWRSARLKIARPAEGPRPADRRSRRPRKVILLLSYLAGLLLITRSNHEPNPLWSELPPREATMEIEVLELFNARKPGRICGIGRILGHDVPFDTISGRRTAFYLESEALFPPGSRLACRAVLTYLPGAAEPDGYVLYLEKRDIFLNLNRGQVLQATAPAGRLEQFRQRLLEKSRGLLGSGSRQPEDPGNVLSSMLLGDRSLLTDERIELYRLTGTFHLFAVSGLHVGSVALCLHWLGGLLGLPGRVRLPIVLAMTWAYVWLTGSSASAVRAGIMISCIGLAWHLLRQPHLFPALVASAWIVLLWQPEQLFSLGFQLSYAVVGAILLMGLPMAKYYRQKLKDTKTTKGADPPLKYALRRALGSLIDLCCVSLAAGMASMPLIIQHFSLFTPAGPLLGILLNPLATFCVMTGSIVLLCGLPTGPMAGYIALLSWPAIHLMEAILHRSVRIPGAFSHRNWDWPPTGTFLILLALALAWALQTLRQNGRDPGPFSFFLPHALILAGLMFTTLQT